MDRVCEGCPAAPAESHGPVDGLGRRQVRRIRGRGIEITLHIGRLKRTYGTYPFIRNHCIRRLRWELAVNEVGHDRDVAVRGDLISDGFDPRAHPEDLMDHDDDRHFVIDLRIEHPCADVSPGTPGVGIITYSRWRGDRASCSAAAAADGGNVANVGVLWRDEPRRSPPRSRGDDGRTADEDEEHHRDRIPHGPMPGVDGIER